MDYWLRKIFNKIYALLHIKTGTIITLVDLVCTKKKTLVFLRGKNRCISRPKKKKKDAYKVCRKDL
jgi:hypothetical protein